MMMTMTMTMMMKSKTHRRIQDFFLGGGATLKNGVSNTNKPPHVFFGRIPVVLESRRSSQGGVRTPCTLPLDPPLKPSSGKS